MMLISQAISHTKSYCFDGAIITSVQASRTIAVLLKTYF